MNYALEEGIVDAFVAYLTGKVTDGAAVYAMPSVESITYPAVVVRVASTAPVIAEISWSDYVRAVIEIGILTEAQDEIDTAGNVVTTARHRNSTLRQSVLTALCVKDSAATPAGLAGKCNAQDLPHGLAGELTAQLIQGVWISSAQPESPLAVMEVDAEKGVLVTKVAIAVLAQAIEIS